MLFSSSSPLLLPITLGRTKVASRGEYSFEIRLGMGRETKSGKIYRRDGRNERREEEVVDRN